MDRRTYESPMEWEYQNKGPFDPTSPFTHAAQGGGLHNGFASPSKESASSRPNPFAPSTQNRPVFTPQRASKPSAPPFRNPSFTTPRKPFDEVVFSEASGAEESPAQADLSDFPNDTPDADRMSDVNMSGTITPAKIDKAFRYQKGGPPSRKHASGKGEIKAHRDFGMGESRRRKRQGLSSFVRRPSQDSDDDSDDDSDASFSNASHSRSRLHKKDKKAAPQGGMVGSMFHMMEEHHTAPQNLHQWIQLGINVFMGGILCTAVMSIVYAVRSDIMAVNEAARQEIRVKMAACQDEYMANGCATTNAPAFKKLCSEWYDCMTQNPDSIVRIRATMTEIAHIMNDFFGNLNLKAWGTFMAIIVLVMFANNMKLGNSSHPAPTTSSAQQHPSHSSGAQMPHHSAGDVMWIPVQTPKMQRHALLGDDTDTDGTPPRSHHFQQPFTPSGRRSPSKRERSLSPIKYIRSPRKDY